MLVLTCPTFPMLLRLKNAGEISVLVCVKLDLVTLKSLLVHFSRSVMSNSLWPHKPQHARPPCPSPTPGVYPNPCPLSWWCQPSYPLSPPSLPALNLSQYQGLFQWVSSSHQVAKVLEFQLQHQCFQWTLGTDLFRMDWLDLLAVHGTFNSLLKHHSAKASILLCSAFFIIQLSHPYMAAGKNIAFTRRKLNLHWS